MAKILKSSLLDGLFERLDLWLGVLETRVLEDLILNFRRLEQRAGGKNHGDLEITLR